MPPRHGFPATPVARNISSICSIPDHSDALWARNTFGGIKSTVARLRGRLLLSLGCIATVSKKFGERGRCSELGQGKSTPTSSLSSSFCFTQGYLYLSTAERCMQFKFNCGMIYLKTNAMEMTFKFVCSRNTKDVKTRSLFYPETWRAREKIYMLIINWRKCLIPTRN